MGNNAYIRYTLGMIPNELDSIADTYANEALLEMQKEDRARVQKGKPKITNDKTEKFTSAYMRNVMQGLDSHIKDLEQQALRCKTDILNLRKQYEQQVSVLRRKETKLANLEKSDGFAKLFCGFLQGIASIVIRFYKDMLKNVVNMAVDLISGDLEISFSSIKQRLLDDTIQAAAKANISALNLVLSNATVVAGQVGGAQAMGVVAKISQTVHSVIKNACSGPIREVVGTVKEFAEAATNPNPASVIADDLQGKLVTVGKKTAFESGKRIATEVVIKKIPSSQLRIILTKVVKNVTLDDIDAFLSAENPIDAEKLLGQLQTKVNSEVSRIKKQIATYPNKALTDLQESAKRQLQNELSQAQLKLNKINESISNFPSKIVDSVLGSLQGVKKDAKQSANIVKDEATEQIQKELFSDDALKDYAKTAAKAGVSAATNAFPPAKAVSAVVLVLSTAYTEFCEASEDLPALDLAVKKGKKSYDVDQKQITQMRQQIAQDSQQIEQTNIQIINTINRKDATEIEKAQYTFCEFFLIRSTNQLEFLAKSFPYMTKEELVTVFFSRIGEDDFAKLRVLVNANMLSLLLRAFFAYVEEELDYQPTVCPLLPPGLLKQVQARYGLDQSNYCKNLSQPEVRAMINAYNKLPTSGPTKATSIESLTKTNKALFQKAEAQFIEKYLPKSGPLRSKILSQLAKSDPKKFGSAVLMKGSILDNLNAPTVITSSIILVGLGLAGYYGYKTYYSAKDENKGE